jgi:DNA-binding LacI/PurR family transcriptional regulator
MVVKWWAVSLVRSTIDDVAAEAGVSRATVSRSLNGGSVSAATRERVLAAAERLGYRPSQAASSLARGRSGVIGLALHAPIADLRCDTYTANLYTGMTDALAAQGIIGVMQWFSRGDRSELADAVVASQFVDGIVATSVDADDVLVRRLIDSGIPAVVVGASRFQGRVSTVDIDDVRGGEVATRHLLQQGARLVGHITGEPSTKSAQDRLTGFHRALDAAGVAERPVTTGSYDGKNCVSEVHELLDQGVDAVFAASDVIAQFVYQAASERGIRIPDDLLVIGFDDIDRAATLDPPLSTMRQDSRGLGTAAAELLLEVLVGHDDRPRSVVLEASLVPRRSTAAAISPTRPEV